MQHNSMVLYHSVMYNQSKHRFLWYQEVDYVSPERKYGLLIYKYIEKAIEGNMENRITQLKYT